MLLRCSAEHAIGYLIICLDKCNARNETTYSIILQHVEIKYAINYLTMSVCLWYIVYGTYFCTLYATLCDAMVHGHTLDQNSVMLSCLALYWESRRDCVLCYFVILSVQSDGTLP